MRSQPRPILKSLPEYSPLPFSTYPLHSPHVHFPPTPSLTSTSFTHSPFAYDRAPIIVPENTCALPERGGRCYTLQPRIKRSSHRMKHCSRVVTSAAAAEEPKGSYFHPRAFEACEPESSGDNDDRHDPYSCSPELSNSSCSSSSSSSSSSDSDSDSSCGYSQFGSSSPSIPRVVLDSIPDPSSKYPQDSSYFLQHSIQSELDSSRQQTALVHYPCPFATAENASEKAINGSGNKGRVKRSTTRSSSSSSNTAARLARFGGGFSDQAIFLDGCLGGF